MEQEIYCQKILEINIKMLGSDGKEYLYEFSDFENIKENSVSVKDNYKLKNCLKISGIPNAEIDLHIECDELKQGLEKFKMFDKEKCKECLCKSCSTQYLCILNWGYGCTGRCIDRNKNTITKKCDVFTK